MNYTKDDLEKAYKAGWDKANVQKGLHVLSVTGSEINWQYYWESVKPLEPGWYWVKFAGGKKEIAELIHNENAGQGEEVDYWLTIGDDHRYSPTRADITVIKKVLE